MAKFLLGDSKFPLKPWPVTHTFPFLTFSDSEIFCIDGLDSSVVDHSLKFFWDEFIGISLPSIELPIFY
jgi:hypothetical protein